MKLGISLDCPLPYPRPNHAARGWRGTLHKGRAMRTRATRNSRLLVLQT